MTTEPRTCQHCHTPLAADAHPRRKYCNHAHARMASYYRKTEEERREINRRSNKHRFETRLLPTIILVNHASDTVEPGSEAAKDAVRMFLRVATTSWPLAHALHFSNARKAMALMAGGYPALEDLEDEIAVAVAAEIAQNMKEAAA